MVIPLNHAAVIERPRLTSEPSNAIGVPEHNPVHFECHFNSSLKQYLAICEWLKDGDSAINGNKQQKAEHGFENYLICSFNINSVSNTDEGNYSCFCFYNKSFREQLHIPKNHEIRSQLGSALLKIKISKMIMYVSTYVILHKYFVSENHNSTAAEIVPFCLLSAIIVVLVIWRVCMYHKQRAGNITR